MNRVNVIDVSDMNGQEFANAVIKSNSPMMIIVGEENNTILNLINQPEHTQNFRIGDVVKLKHEILEFNGVKDTGRTYIVFGLEKVDDQYLYTCGNERYKFFGYELEKAF